MDQNVLRKAINEYVEMTGVKKKYIAQAIQESPDNFSRWLTGKRNYGETREKQIIQFLQDRGVSYDWDIQNIEQNK